MITQSRVEGMDAVGGSPYCDFANEGSGMISCYRPGWRVVTVPDAILDLLGEVGDKLGWLGQVASPDRIGIGR